METIHHVKVQTVRSLIAVDLIAQSLTVQQIYRQMELISQTDLILRIAQRIAPNFVMLPNVTELTAL